MMLPELPDLPPTVGFRYVHLFDRTNSRHLGTAMVFAPERFEDGSFGDPWMTAPNVLTNGRFVFVDPANGLPVYVQTFNGAGGGSCFYRVVDAG